MKEKTKLLVRIAIGIAMFSMVVLLISLQIQLKNLQTEKDRFKATLEEYRKTVEELEYDLTLERENYIEKYAREVLGYHKYGELVFRK